MMKVLIVESEFLHQDTWVGNAVERLADALSQQNVTVIKSTSFDDGFAILSSNEAIDCLMFSYQMEHPDEHQNVRQLIGKLHERQQNVPVFLLGDREKALAAMDRDLLELVDGKSFLCTSLISHVIRWVCKYHINNAPPQ